jgi:chromosome segregation ATPase
VRSELEALSKRLVQLEASSRESQQAIDSLQGDSSRIIAHLGTLQKDHDDVKLNGWSREERMTRLEELWSDVQRDLTALAEALGRLTGD